MYCRYKNLPEKLMLLMTVYYFVIINQAMFFDLAGHIKKVDGWFGLYRGLGPRYIKCFYCFVWIFFLFCLKQEQSLKRMHYFCW